MGISLEKATSSYAGLLELSKGQGKLGFEQLMGNSEGLLNDAARLPLKIPIIEASDALPTRLICLLGDDMVVPDAERLNLEFAVFVGMRMVFTEEFMDTIEGKSTHKLLTKKLAAGALPDEIAEILRKIAEVCPPEFLSRDPLYKPT